MEMANSRTGWASCRAERLDSRLRLRFVSSLRRRLAQVATGAAFVRGQGK